MQQFLDSGYFMMFEYGNKKLSVDFVKGYLRCWGTCQTMTYSCYHKECLAPSNSNSSTTNGQYCVRHSNKFSVLLIRNTKTRNLFAWISGTNTVSIKPGSFNLRLAGTFLHRTFNGRRVTLDSDEWEMISKFSATSYDQCLGIKQTGLFVTSLLFSLKNSRTSQIQERLWLFNKFPKVSHLDLDMAIQLLKANKCEISLGDPSPRRNAEWFLGDVDEKYTPDRVSTGHYIVYLRFGLPGYLYGGKHTVIDKQHPKCPYIPNRHHRSYKGLPVFVIQGSSEDKPEVMARNNRIMELNESVLQSAIITCQMLGADISGYPIKRDFLMFDLRQNWDQQVFDRFKRQIETLSGRTVVINYNFEIDQLDLGCLNNFA